MSERPLREALVEFSDGWREDLPKAWQEALQDVEPDAGAVGPSLTIRDDEVIFPARKGNPLPNAPEGSHVFHAFDGLPPEKVRAVIIGQDPYPRVSRATGRSFDQGDLKAWTPSTTVSLRKIVQAVAYEKTGDLEYLEMTGWTLATKRMKEGSLTLPGPKELFDGWEAQGVLLLNAGLTISRYVQGGAPEQAKGHIPFWSPVIRAVIKTLTQRETGHVAFLVWGKFAENVVKGSGVTSLPGWGDRAFMVKHVHPAAYSGFLVPPGPFAEANKELEARGAAPIEWCP